MSILSMLIGCFYDKHLSLQLGVTLLVYTFIRLCLFIRVRQKRYRLFEKYGITGPETDLIGGNMNLYLREESMRYKVDEYCSEKYGKTFRIFIGDEPGMITTDLELLRKIFLENSKSFKERSFLFMKTPLSDSVLFARYDRWKLMRKKMSPSFSSYQMRGAESVEFVEDSIKLMMSYIEQKIDLSPGGKIELDVQDLMKAAALHMISEMAIRLPDVRVEENEKNVKSLDAFLAMSDKGLVNYAIKFPFISRALSFIATHFEYDKTIASIHRCLNQTIDKELDRLNARKCSAIDRNSSKRQDQLIDLLIRLHHEGKLTREEVVSNADAVLFAGYDTTSTTLTYVFWVLGMYPDVQEKLRNDLLTYGTQSRYMEQVFSETMRLYPTVICFTSRVATETVTIDDLTIPQGTKVVYNAWLMYRNPDIWPDPLKFDPERFKVGVEHHPCAFAPFGLGERKCLGYQLAKLEMKMIVCDALLRYKIHTKSPKNLEIITYANVLTKPSEKVIIEMERFNMM